MYVRKKNVLSEGMFFMRFYNQTGSNVSSYFNNLFVYSTGIPILLTAVVKRSGGVLDDVKGVGNSIINFNVANNEQCVFRMTWTGGVFCLQGGESLPHRNIVRSTWENCSSLITSDVPDTSNWNITGSIGTYFMGSSWLNCSSLTTAVVPDTSNWNVTSIGGTYFMRDTWSGCTALTTAIVPDTSNWNVTTIGNYFMQNTFTNALSTLGAIIILKGGIYTGSSIKGLQTNSCGLIDARVINIKVDSGLISTYQSSPSWTNITPSKFISW